MIPVCRLNGYATDMGFESERERLAMILTAMQKNEQAVEDWLDTDGTCDGLVKILEAKRKVRRPELDV